jgi:hypothetical protein
MGDEIIGHGDAYYDDSVTSSTRNAGHKGFERLFEHYTMDAKDNERGMPEYLSNEVANPPSYIPGTRTSSVCNIVTTSHGTEVQCTFSSPKPTDDTETTFSYKS